ncbi:MAG: glycosyltransferase family 39 protein [Actinobacteria bacterium]|nr:glycosyltransferase family 39 protein [Actinomycetota bacterium]
MAAVLIAILSFCLRLWNLGTPKGLVFDELYYVDGARDLLKYGVEVTGSGSEFIVHPPVGKWLIGIGIKLFGDNEFGWRFSVAVIGSLLILLVARVAMLLFRSRGFSTLASLLMALDGLQLVHSRTALLDLFLTFFVLLATLAWLKDRYWLSGILFGLALGTKWSAIYFLIAFALILVYRDYSTNQLGVKRFLLRITQLGITPLLVYISTWFGWFASPRGWDRHWAQTQAHSFIPNIVRSFWHYHAEILHFHTHLTSQHSYQANPWSWLVMGRPTSFYYETPKTCGASSCAQEVVALGTPFLWWLGTLAIFTVLGYWITSVIRKKPDKAAGIILVGIAAGYLPWFLFQKRTVFSFYAIVFEPFLILAVV